MLVTVEEPKTAKFAAVLRSGSFAAATVTVNVADALAGVGNALSVTVTVAGPDSDDGFVIVMPLNVPVAVDFGCDAGVTTVPLNVKCRIDVCAKPIPDTLSAPGRPDVGVSEIDADGISMLPNPTLML